MELRTDCLILEVQLVDPDEFILVRWHVDDVASRSRREGQVAVIDSDEIIISVATIKFINVRLIVAITGTLVSPSHLLSLAVLREVDSQLLWMSLNRWFFSCDALQTGKLD